MDFILMPPNEPREVFGDMWVIFGNGLIELETGKHLTKLVADNAIPRRSILHLNSLGGSLVGGIDLGKAIRGAGLFTYISQAGAEEAIGEFRYRKSEPGGCYSAGALAFLGGLYRWIDEQSAYGVHRFYADTDPGSDIAQRLSSKIVEYIGDMGVDPALFSEMTKAGRDEINVLSSERLQELGIINGPSNRTAWSLESVGEGGLYFKGERVTWRGVNKFIIMAGPKGTLLHTIFDPEGREEEATTMRAHSLFVDDGAHPIEPIGAEVINGLVNCWYDLTPELLDKVKTGKTVGIALQWAREAPVFLGFNYVEIEDGRLKLLGYLSLFGR